MEAKISTPPQAEFKPSSLFEYILTYHRGWFATIFLLPVSVIYTAHLRLRRNISFRLHSAPAQHAKR